MGFFKGSQLSNLSKMITNNSPSCLKCGLYKSCNSSKMKASGDMEKGIFVLSDIPSKLEDNKNEPLIDGHGRKLRKIFEKYGVDLDRDCRKMYAVNCYSDNSPTDDQIKYCLPAVIKEIKKCKPKMIFLLGPTAIRSVIGYRFNKIEIGSIQKWRGFLIPDQELGWLIPMYHPSFIQKNYKKDVAAILLENDILRAMSVLSYDCPTEIDFTKYVHVLWDDKRVLKFLRGLIKNPPVCLSFDYETTGLKPDAAGHEIASCAICHNERKSFSFLVTDRIKPLLKRVLQNKSGKIAANLKFEERWSRAKLGISVNKWIWDTQLASHILDNREGINSLDFQTYVNFGVPDYSSHLKKYLQSGSKNANSLNNIKKANQEELLIYGGLDALFEYKLAMQQMKRFSIIDVEKYVNGEWNQDSFIDYRFTMDEPKEVTKIKRTKKIIHKRR